MGDVRGYLAAAAVTEALRRRVQTAFLDVAPLSAGPLVTTGRPTGEDGGHMPEVGANIYLFQVAPNAGLRNRDLPTRDAAGMLLHRSEVALDLSYLLTFYGREDLLEPQRLLGRALVALHVSPVFQPEDLARLSHGPHAVPFLSGDTAAPPVAPVRLMPVSLTLEELSKIWTVFFQAAHRLSVAYQASPASFRPMTHRLRRCRRGRSAFQ